MGAPTEEQRQKHIEQARSMAIKEGFKAGITAGVVTYGAGYVIKSPKCKRASVGRRPLCSLSGQREPCFPSSLPLLDLLYGFLCYVLLAL